MFAGVFKKYIIKGDIPEIMDVSKCLHFKFWSQQFFLSFLMEEDI